MPETIYIGANSTDFDFINPADYRVQDIRFSGPHAKADVAAEKGEGIIAEYRLVRLLEVTKTTPAPIIEVKEVPQ